MKFLVLLGLIALAASAPQPRKLFHEHFEDFLDLIEQEAGGDIQHLFEHYIEFDEFRATLDYLATQNFRDLIYELESLPEFTAVVDFLERDNIDILFFIDNFNSMIENIRDRSRTLSGKQTRHAVSGTDFKSFMTDCISEFPQAKLAALFEEKKAEDEEFNTAVENLKSEEWERIFNTLWENETFLKEVEAFEAHGIYIEVLLDEILAVFGQKYVGKM